MNEPVKEGVCRGCRAKSFLQCLTCMFMLEGRACQENTEALMEPIELSPELQEVK